MSSASDQARIGFLQNLVDYLANTSRSGPTSRPTSDIIFNCGAGSGSQSCPPSASATCPPQTACPPLDVVEISLQDMGTKSRYTRTDLENIAEACNTLLVSFCKDWNFAKHQIKVYNKDETPKARFNSYFMDYAPISGALALHTYDSKKGIAKAYSYTETHMEFGNDPKDRRFFDPSSLLFPDGIKRGTSNPASLLHEIFETLTNYYVNSYVEMDGEGGFDLYQITNFDTGNQVSIESFYQMAEDAITRGEKLYIAIEGANPVQSNLIEVSVKGRKIEVTDYVKPSWFTAKSSDSVSYLNTIKKPFEIDIGGYVDLSLEGVRYFNSRPMIYSPI